ncbi:E3 SUMO-protein ligase ZBED1-like [Pangasianodon hypophthalmus]|uniref:E3 SUMO-protein ligase ZBED1-like n=1 Tax=Pangasianodon hypophthalmus TaxID=310915 RepID=UPI0023071BEC|nr:E3 SUMO-protein ligase ZBED1-like [Pangasianodon hypophthalmus]
MQQLKYSTSASLATMKQLFAVKAKKGNCVIMSCQLCLPRPVEISAFKSSSSNLKKHIERKHPSKLKQYNECVLKGKNSEEQRCDSAVKQMKIKDYSMSCRQVTQSTIDRLVVEFVCESLQPFTIVELPTFKNLIHTMQPSCTVMSRPTVKLRIEEAAAKVKKNIIAEMAKVSYIGTTTDCWTARQRSYIGVTAHWIDESTLERRSASIAFRRLKGSHTFDLLAGTLDDIHSEYGISGKIVRTTTASGSKLTGADSAEAVTLESEEDAEGVEVQDTCSILNTNSGLEYHLPEHQRCACHLKLVATVDTSKAEDSSEIYKKLTRSTFAKCHQCRDRPRRM